jgi:hypothetical protein
MSTVTTNAVVIPEESSISAVSWGAIAAGAVVSAAFSLFLLHLVAGLGLVSVSPWSNSGASTTTMHVAGGIALVLMAVMASALAGYLAARLRTRWVGLHTDEVYFRDSAHGIIAWAFATVITATALASASGLIATSVVQGVASNPAVAPDRNAYLVDTLFRSDQPVTAADQPALQAATGESSRILGRGLAPGADISSADRTRIAQLVSARTGLPQAEAQQRVDAAITQAKAAADEARKAAAKLAFWFAAALLAGALSAGIAAVEGGRLRDDVDEIGRRPLR